MNGLLANVKYIDVPVKTMFNSFDTLIAAHSAYDMFHGISA